jgi:hypothetical protein
MLKSFFFKLRKKIFFLIQKKRSLEELFSLFIACTLTIEAFKSAIRMLNRAFLPHCFEILNNSSKHLLLLIPPHPPSPDHPLPQPQHEG